MQVRVPEEGDRAFVHRIIHGELARGVLAPSTRDRCRDMTATMVSRGARGVVLACTELPLPLSDEDATVPLFATTTLHAGAAAPTALGRWT